jgi:hypothetical protein
MNAHIIAVDTYGAQRVTDPQTGKTVSAYKLGVRRVKLSA